eukprot:TRINITY_DN7580_c0_g1_i1.p1 TRINITY_DN7580_c0_g1~~TRINITY_DN7580_c0_g1_i1.p1  ORF type:complete len:385 (-),score=49.16 TRINITY_DN7580_c0_g1_i1:60-1214(-)
MVLESLEKSPILERIKKMSSPKRMRGWESDDESWGNWQEVSHRKSQSKPANLPKKTTTTIKTITSNPTTTTTVSQNLSSQLKLTNSIEPSLKFSNFKTSNPNPVGYRLPLSLENVNVWAEGWQRESYPERDLEIPTEALKAKWRRQQREYADDLILTDSFSWTLTPNKTNTLRYIGGLDISFVRDSKIDACACIVICEYPDMNVVWECYQMMKLTAPYIPGLLAFREVPIFLEMLEKLRKDKNPYYPELLMIDGNGILHMRGMGQACHLGLLADIPCFGVAKKLLVTDGINDESIGKAFARSKSTSDRDSALLIGDSGVRRAYAHHWNTKKHGMEILYISAGHRISLETCLAITKTANKGNSLPEPVYQADHLSREILKMNGMK